MSLYQVISKFLFSKRIKIPFFGLMKNRLTEEKKQLP